VSAEFTKTLIDFTQTDQREELLRRANIDHRYRILADQYGLTVNEFYGLVQKARLVPELRAIRTSKQPTKAQLLDFIERGYGSAKIAKEIGYSLTSTLYFLRKHHLLDKRVPWQCRRIDWSDLLPLIPGLVAQHKSLGRLAEKLGVSREPLITKLAEMGITKYKWKTYDYAKLDPAIIELVSRGLSHQKVADELGIKTYLVGDRLRANHTSSGKILADRDHRATIQLIAQSPNHSR
jgi:AraC-like DNA-binding protein